MPWIPELFSAPALARLEEERRQDRLWEVSLRATATPPGAFLPLAQGPRGGG